VSKKKTTSKHLNPQLSRPEHRQPTAEEFLDGILYGDRVLLGRAITLVESRAERHQALAQEIIERCLPHAGRSVRIGITGSPGVGKSTFIEALGLHIIGQGSRPAVLAVDPTSQASKGSILGDKTRMEQLSQRDEAFIRPSPAGESLGGVSRKTREAIILCETAGYDTIIVETVGVGQSETAVHSMVDCFVLLLLPGAGDELQGIKRGIIEMADLLAINKADGERLPLARQSKKAYQSALHLFPPKESSWRPTVQICSALEGRGIPEVWAQVQQFLAHIKKNSYFSRHRRNQALFWLYETVDARLRDLFYNHPAVKEKRSALEQAVLEGRLTSFQAAEELLRLIK
jgi:LAO/AO transport system kinase